VREDPKRVTHAGPPTILFECSPADYRAIPSVQEIVLIEQDQRFCHLHRRAEEGWMTDLLRGERTLLRLRTIDLEVPLSELYENVPFDEAAFSSE
jgi:hypothetical protein